MITAAKIYEETFSRNKKDGRALRWRIEHGQHLAPADIARFARLGVIASMQTVRATSDAPFVVARLGERRAREGAYVWQRLLEAGAMVGNGTDAPVESVDPIANYYSAVTRRTQDDAVFYGDQRMSRLEALHASTVSNAFAAFEEDLKGTLTVGKLADVTVLNRDLTTVPDAAIREMSVVYTIIGGKIVYRGN